MAARRVLRLGLQGSRRVLSGSALALFDDKISIDVGFDMVNRVEGFVFDDGEGAGGEGADEK